MLNFFDLVKDNGMKVAGDFGTIPSGPGCYLLFDETGYFIYVGKATNLNTRITYHFSQDESNARIKSFVKYVVWETTLDVEAAEKLEGEIFDHWVNHTNQYPFANLVAPPKARNTRGYDPRYGRLQELLKTLRSNKE
jgi:predicted GIY-YIG superfamily endonuclease